MLRSKPTLQLCILSPTNQILCHFQAQIRSTFLDWRLGFSVCIKCSSSTSDASLRRWRQNCTSEIIVFLQFSFIWWLLCVSSEPFFFAFFFFHYFSPIIVFFFGGAMKKAIISRCWYISMSTLYTFLMTYLCVSEPLFVLAFINFALFYSSKSSLFLFRKTNYGLNCYECNWSMAGRIWLWN